MHDTLVILADGTVFSGIGFGLPAPSIEALLSSSYEETSLGELVFNTTMGAYHEIITDPSYAGQSIVFTSAHIGNYGVDEQWNEMLHDTVSCKVIIAREVYEGPLPPNRASLAKQCEKWNVCGIHDVDTRSLTHHLRDHGSMYGVLVRAEIHNHQAIAAIAKWMALCPPMSERDFVSKVAVPCEKTFSPEKPKRATYALWDFGAKQSILSQLLLHGIEVVVFPCTTPLVQIFAEGHHFDALFLSNGPGDPEALESYVMQLRMFMGSIPILGICLGHQLASKALGAKTEKMLYGHHGANHPVRDLETQQVAVTAQNHSYCVVPTTLPRTTTTWLINDNDKTLEGLYDNQMSVMTVQFHPEAGPGPWEGRKLFNRFIDFATAANTKMHS